MSLPPSCEFEERRNALLQLLDSSICPVDFARFQADLAAEIIETERLKAQQRQNRDLQFELKRHLHLCHHLGDGLAWRLLERHTIRQLAKGQGSPPWLSHQLVATNEALETVNRLANELNLPALIADLTNIVRIGDVIVLKESECPLIIELKSSASGPLKEGYANRASRQLLRMKLAAEYLQNDRGTIFGTETEIRALTIQHYPEYLYEEVETVCTAALENGFSTCVVNDHDVLFCARYDQPLSDCLGKAPPFPLRYLVVGGHHRFLDEEVHPLLRPLPVWPISLHIRKALLNRDLDLFHLVDPNAIVGFEKSGWAVESFNQESGGYQVHRGEQSLLAPHQWLDLWLYGFEKSDSMANAMMEAVRLTMEEYPDCGSIAKGANIPVLRAPF